MSARRLDLVVLAGVTLLSAACGGSAGPAVTSKPFDPETANRDITPSDQMWHHFIDVGKARDAVMEGDLEAVRPPLRRIAGGQYGAQIPAEWKPRLRAMQAAARAGAQVSDLAGAAQSVAAVAGQCAACHQDLGRGPQLEGNEFGYRPRTRDELSEAMQRHAWATEELWLGITVPHGPAWQRGAAALDQMTILQPTPGDKPIDPAVQTAIEEIRAMGTVALAADKPARRQAVFGKLLERCGACHGKLGVKLPRDQGH